jgi:hypothetical protein
MKHRALRLLALLGGLVTLLPACGRNDAPPAEPIGSLASLGWSPGAEAVLHAAPAGDSLGQAPAGSRWIVLDSLAVQTEGSPRLWLKVRQGQQSGWVDSGREPHELEEGRIATH